MKFFLVLALTSLSLKAYSMPSPPVDSFGWSHIELKNNQVTISIDYLPKQCGRESIDLCIQHTYVNVIGLNLTSNVGVYFNPTADVSENKAKFIYLTWNGKTFSGVYDGGWIFLPWYGRASSGHWGELALVSNGQWIKQPVTGNNFRFSFEKGTAY